MSVEKLPEPAIDRRMMNSDGTAQSPPQSNFYPPQAESRTFEPATSADAVQPTNPRSRKSVWLVAAIVVASVAALVALSVVYKTTANERDDAERALSDSEANLAETEANLTETKSNLATSEANLADTEANLADNQADLATSEANLAKTEAELAETETRVTDYRDATADFLALSLATASPVGEDGATCMADALVGSLGPKALRLLASSESSDDFTEFGLETMRVASDCDVPLDTFTPQTGSAYGDNPALDALYDECAGGVGASCDALYQQSGVQTEYEAFGLTCGNRFKPEQSPPVCEGNI